MKKAKLMVSAIAVFAVLGTAVAVKASKFKGFSIYTGTLNSKVCTSSVDQLTITATPAGEAANFAASTASNAVNCPDVFVAQDGD